MRTLSKLKLIPEKARKDKGFKFNSLAHLINEESLSWCYGELKFGKAPGIDGVGVLKYGENLGSNFLNKILLISPMDLDRKEVVKPNQVKRYLGRL